MAISKNILLVEDEEILYDIYIKMLTERGYNVILANNGKKGYKILRKEKPDLVLLDILLPVMDGFMFLKKIKKDASIKNIPVIILSNLGQDSDIAKGLELGAVDYCIKNSTSIDELLEKIKKYLA
ncbi:MAG: response regulator [bacterium]|nr:response regulator [bacterium]